MKILRTAMLGAVDSLEDDELEDHHRECLEVERDVWEVCAASAIAGHYLPGRASEVAKAGAEVADAMIVQWRQRYTIDVRGGVVDVVADEERPRASRALARRGKTGVQ